MERIKLDPRKIVEYGTAKVFTETPFGVMDGSAITVRIDGRMFHVTEYQGNLATAIDMASGDVVLLENTD